jgi:hypothetical protein
VGAGATTVDWQQGQDALRDEVRRVTALLRSVGDPAVHAVGQWSLGEVAMHLSQACTAHSINLLPIQIKTRRH